VRGPAGGIITDKGVYTAKNAAHYDVVEVTDAAGCTRTIEIDLQYKKAVLASAVPVRGDLGARVPVSLAPATPPPSADQILWTIIRDRSAAVGFGRYKGFIDKVMCEYQGEREGGIRRDKLQTLHHPSLRYGTRSYEVLKAATDLFLKQECGVELALQDWDFEDEARRMGRSPSDTTASKLEQLRKDYLVKVTSTLSTVPYLAEIVKKLEDLPLKGAAAVIPNCYGILEEEVSAPCLLEPIWSLWMEACGVPAAADLVGARFTNKRVIGRNGLDPLARFDVVPLRPMAHLLYGYQRDAQHRLEPDVRDLEFLHAYGMTPPGRAPTATGAADSRTRFSTAFNNLLHAALQFHRDANNTFIVPDPFPVLVALKELNLLLTEGMHNQYNDFTWNARAEGLIQAWLLARPEMQEFLGGRPMVNQRETWIDRAQTLRSLCGWGDAPAMHYRDLAVFGEQILLSIRFGNWIQVDDKDVAAGWANYWRSEIEGYAFAYGAVSGVDLTRQLVATTLAAPAAPRAVARTLVPV
jgi:hypothetical protein